MRVIVVNSGSSSIKYKVFTLEDLTTLVEGLLERIGTGEARLKPRRLTDSDDWEEIIETRPIADHREGLEFILDVLEDGCGAVLIRTMPLMLCMQHLITK